MNIFPTFETKMNLSQRMSFFFKSTLKKSALKPEIRG